MNRTLMTRPRVVASCVAAATVVVAVSVVAPVAGIAAPAPGSATPDFGPNVKIFYPGTPVGQINAYLQAISHDDQFSANRHAVFFMPGTYGSPAGAGDPATATGVVDSQVGYYTSIAGLGASPQDVVINGAPHVEPVASAFGENSLVNFWRSLGNLTVNPIQSPAPGNPGSGDAPHTMRWSVSQASPLRRVNILGNLDLNGAGGSVGFGSELANSRVTGTVLSGDAASGQDNMRQWFTRNSAIGSWDGTGVNYVFTGVKGAPRTDFTATGVTSLRATPAVREAPFLMVSSGKFEVFVPSATANSSGYNWSTGAQAGRSIPISRFFIAKPADSAETINRALASGQDLLMTPGVYSLDEPIKVTRPDTVVLGIGYATLTPADGTAAIEVGRADGVVVSGLVVDAGPVNSPVLVRVGDTGTQSSQAGDSRDPTTLSDLFVRVGGAAPGSATTSVEIDSNDVIVDDSWLWRADHGNGVGWTDNVAEHGLIVNGNHVTALGLSVEHYQQAQLIWNGKDGMTISFQSEFPYDPPSQAAWMDGTSEGYPAYLVTSAATTHRAIGLVTYAVNWFAVTLHADHAIQAPVTPAIRFRSMSTGVIIGNGGVRHIIDNTGDPVDAANPNNAFGLEALARLGFFPALMP